MILNLEDKNKRRSLNLTERWLYQKRICKRVLPESWLSASKIEACAHSSSAPSLIMSILLC